MRTDRDLLRRDRLEWPREAPESQADAPLSVQVCIIEPEPVSEEHTRGLVLRTAIASPVWRGGSLYFYE